MHGCIYLDSSQCHNESHQIIQLSETSAPPKIMRFPREQAYIVKRIRHQRKRMCIESN